LSRSRHRHGSQRCRHKKHRFHFAPMYLELDDSDLPSPNPVNELLTIVNGLVRYQDSLLNFGSV
jgi:hypothetical protein